MPDKLEIDRKVLEELNYGLADLLVYIDGFRTSVRMNTQGNKEQRQAYLDLCNWVDKCARESKVIVSEIISK